RARPECLGRSSRRVRLVDRSCHRRARSGRPSARAPAARGRGAGAARVTVYLVGAGPGDPGLLTARALELVGAADVIVYDRLIPDSALDGARADAELIYAGKQGGRPSMPQSEIERLLLDRARRGLMVVRLKGGDP